MRCFSIVPNAAAGLTVFAYRCSCLANTPCTTISQTSTDHSDHHTKPRSNYAPFFTWLDDACGSNFHDRPRCTLLFVAAAFVYQAALLATAHLLLTCPLRALAAWVVLYLMVTPQQAAALFDALHVPEAVRWALGWLMDAYRRDACVTYAEPGRPGAFTPNASSADGAAQPYLFAVHPTGVLSRGALLTFAACGRDSPVVGLKRVRLAVGNTLFQLPIVLVREALLALGCVPASRALLKAELLAGTSIAITPGGFREPTHTGQYQLLIKERRRGFVSLALETGAALVPVSVDF